MPSEGMGSCRTCGREFSRAYSQQHYCSLPCRPSLIARQPKPRERCSHRSCEVCGTIYRAKMVEQRTCGRACGVELRRRSGDPRFGRPRTKWPASRIWVQPCVVCGGLFVSRRNRKRWTCSNQCGDRETNQRRRPPPTRYPCSGCATLLPIGRRKCDDCLAADRKIRRKQDKRRRRALKAGVLTERYTLAEIAARDSYKCGLCHRQVAMDKAAPHPKSPSIDHVVPLAELGDDTRANVQLAHFSCNVFKQAGGSQQLAMFG